VGVKKRDRLQQYVLVRDHLTNLHDFIKLMSMKLFHKLYGTIMVKKHLLLQAYEQQGFMYLKLQPHQRKTYIMSRKGLSLPLSYSLHLHCHPLLNGILLLLQGW
jgi:hypothetical protein